MKKSRMAWWMMIVCVVCFLSACGSEAMRESKESDPFSDIGIAMDLPDEYKNSVGTIDTYSSDISSGDGVYVGFLDYIGYTKKDYQAIISKEDLSEDEINEYYSKVVPLIGFVVIDQDRDADELVDTINEIYGEDFTTKERLTLLGKAGDCSFFYNEASEDDAANIENLDDALKKEYEELVSMRKDILDGLEFSEVARPYDDLIGKKVSFETTDFEGNKVSSEEIFRKNEITMVNVWATWCHNCLDELQDLEALNKELAQKDCGIIGLCGDAESDEVLESAKTILDENHVTYQNILPFEGWEDTFDISSGWPTSFFVDKDGTIVGKPVVGALLERYETRFEELLKEDVSQEASTEEDAKEVADTDAGAYRIYVYDQDTNPVEGVMVQFCTDEICELAPTDSDGLASFTDPEGVYEVHILKVPEGYKENTEVYLTEDTYSGMTINIEKV